MAETFTAADARSRLQDLARSKGKSLAELSRVIGRNPAYLQQYVARGSPRQLDEPDVRRIAEYLGVPPRALDCGVGGGAVGEGPAGWRDVPRLAIGASAGPGAFGAQEQPYDHFRLSERWLQENGLAHAQLSAIRVEGDSMVPILNSGDEIFVDRAKRAGEGIFVVRIGDALHVKQISASAPGRIVLVSANPAYADLDLPRGDVEVIGRVVWKGGRV